MIYEIAKLGGVCRSAPVQQERSSIIHSLGDELFWLKVGFSFLLNCKLGDPFDPETDQGPSGAHLQFKF